MALRWISAATVAAAGPRGSVATNASKTYEDCDDDWVLARLSTSAGGAAGSRRSARVHSDTEA